MFVNSATGRNGSVMVISWKRYSLLLVRVCVRLRRVKRNRLRNKNNTCSCSSTCNKILTSYLYILINLHNLFLAITWKLILFHLITRNNLRPLVIRDSTPTVRVWRSLNSTKFRRSITTISCVILVSNIFRIVATGFVRLVKSRGNCISCVRNVMIINCMSIPKIIGLGWTSLHLRMIFLWQMKEITFLIL